MSHTEHLLLVEDDPGLRELLQEELEAEGYRVTACASAEAAQPLLQQGEIDLLISDLRLPGANGLSLLPVAQGLNPAPAMLIITAFGSVQQAAGNGPLPTHSEPFAGEPPLAPRSAALSLHHGSGAVSRHHRPKQRDATTVSGYPPGSRRRRPTGRCRRTPR